MTGPLAGFRVLDLTANMSGPYATMILAEQGADVVKVEPPGGEIIRRVGTGRGGMSAYFENLNHGKRSVVVDLQAGGGADVIKRLSATADVFVQNYRPGIVERLGLGPDQLCAAYPNLIYASISGYGRIGPLADAPAYDHLVQAMTGMAALQETPGDGTPSLVRHGLVDKATGMAVAQAVTAALLRRSSSGNGSYLEISMLDVALHFLWPDGMMNHTCLEPMDIQPAVSRGFRLTRTADGYISLVTVTDKQWEGLVAALGMQDRLDDPDLQGTEARMRNGGRVMRQVAKEIASMTTEQVTDLLREYDVPCMPVIPLEEVAEQEQVRATGSLVEREHPILGRLVGPVSPVRFAGEDRMAPAPAPPPGAHTDEVLSESGFSAAEIARLRRDGVVS